MCFFLACIDSVDITNVTLKCDLESVREINPVYVVN